MSYTSKQQEYIDSVEGIYHAHHRAVEIIGKLQTENERLYVACGFAKAHIKNGSPKKALPVLREALKGGE